MGSGASTGLTQAVDAASPEELAAVVSTLPTDDLARLSKALKGNDSGTRLPRGIELISSRHCTRSFDSSKQVPPSIIKDIVEGSRSLPTSANTQPWTIFVIQGEKRNALSAKLIEKLEKGEEGKTQFDLAPESMTDRMQQAVIAFGKQSYSGSKADCDFYGAPVHILLCAPLKQSITEGVNGILIDMGSLLTATLLGAHSYGLGACPQISVAMQHDICREVLGKEQLPDDLLVICGVSIGYPIDGRDPRVQPEVFPARLSVDETTRWGTCDASWLSAKAGAAGDSGDHTLLQLIQSRHCSHSLDTGKPVSKDIVEAILAAASNVPSWCNSQPWSVTVIQGEARDKLSTKCLEEFDAGMDGGQTYKKYSEENTPQMQKGKDTYGYELYEKKYGLDRGDKDGRRLKYRPNYEFWGAPVLLLLTLPKSSVSGTFIDVGSFMYGILVGMHAYGLGGKPLGSVAKKTDTIRELLGAAAMPEDEHLICGLAIGWPSDGRDPRKTPDFYPSRLTLEETTRWVTDSEW